MNLSSRTSEISASSSSSAKVLGVYFRQSAKTSPSRKNPKKIRECFERDSLLTKDNYILEVVNMQERHPFGGRENG